MPELVVDLQIDRASPVPAYYQIEEWLTERIESGELRPGTRLPSERELTERLGVSRMTLRQALSRLEQEGLVVRRQGAGAFVGRRKLVGVIGGIRGISEEVSDQSRTMQTRVLGIDELLAPGPAQEALGLPARAQAIRVRRVRVVDGEPLSLETSWLHPRRCRAVLEADLARSSLTDVLVHRCGLRLARGHERISATVLDAFEAEVLGAPRGSAALRVQGTTWDASGAPVEHVISVLRGDRFSLEADLEQPLAVQGSLMHARDGL